MLLGKEVAAGYRPACHLVGPAAPDAERSAIGLVPLGEGARLAPQRQQWSADAAACLPVGAVVFTVDAGGGAVLLCDRVDVVGRAERGDVGIADVGAET